MVPRIPDATWEQYKPTIKRVYLDEGKTREETREYMRSQHGFDARYATLTYEPPFLFLL